MNLQSIALRNIELRGDPSYRGKCAVEDAELMTFRNQLEIEFPQYAAVLIHPKNEGKRFKHQADADRAKGALNTGASDIVIVGFPACIIEMKRRNPMESKITFDQLDYLENSQQLGCWVCVALGWEAAMDFVREWHRANYA